MKTDDLSGIERKIVIGMIINTKYLRKAYELIDTKWVLSREARLLMTWVYEYFKKYKKAPNSDIQDIYMEKLRLKKVHKKQAEVIEDILGSLSGESEDTEINFEYLHDQTILYCKACKIALYAEEVQDKLDEGEVLEAESMLTGYTPVESITSNAKTPLGTLQQIRSAHESFYDPLIKYRGALGDYINPHMTKEGFVVFLGQNKGGKSFWLMDAAIRAADQGKNVVLAQCGDMSQEQMERRIAIYLAKKSDLKMYSGLLNVPILDCVHNQNDSCSIKFREGGQDMEGPFGGYDLGKVRGIPSFDLFQALRDYHDHVPCYNCLRSSRFHSKFKGAIWYKKRKPVEPLNWKDTYHLVNKKFKTLLSRIKIITYPSEGLTMAKLNAEADLLEKTGFMAHVYVVDYLDLMAPDRDTLSMKPNDQENKKWQRARRFSQEKKVLFISGSQSDADGFTVRFLEKKNFSTDRRKLDHVTAMFGLNMTIDEKVKGILRLNSIAARETDGASFVHVLHRLEMGRPVMGSFI